MRGFDRSDDFSLWRGIDDAPRRVSWRFRGGRITRMDGRRSERVARSSRAREEPSRILLDGEFVTHELALGVKLCRKKSESIFFPPCLLWLRTQVPMIAFVSLRESRKERDVSLEKPSSSSSSSFQETRSWSWLKYRHKLRKLRASRIENIVHFATSTYYLIWIENHAFFPLILYHSCVCFIKGYLSCVTSLHFFLYYLLCLVIYLIYSVKISLTNFIFGDIYKVRKIPCESNWRLKFRNITLKIRDILSHHFKLSLIYFGLYISIYFTKT